MSAYEVGLRTTVVTTATATVEVRAGTRRVQIHELGITLQAATASTFGLGRPANSGSTAGGTNNAPQPGDVADAAAGFSVISTGQTTAPTAPAVFFRRIGFPATIGSGVIWTFRNLIVPVSGALVLWNLSAVGVSDVYLVAEEQ